MKNIEEKTTKEWLESLPEPHRIEAIQNTDPEILASDSIKTFDNALSGAFAWKETPQGYGYWSDLLN